MTPEDEIRGNLQNLGRQIKSQLPEGFAFSLLVAQLGEGGTMLYVANVRREDALQMMREFVAVNMEERNWQQEMPKLEIEEEFDSWWVKQMKRMPNYSSNGKIREMCRDAFIAGRATA